MAQKPPGTKKHPTIFDLLGPRGVGLLGARVSETEILARLFLKVLIARRVKASDVQNLMESYLNDPVNRIDPAKYLSVRGNLIKELGRSKVTWRGLLKGIRFLRAGKMEITLKLWWPDSAPTVASFKARLRDGVQLVDDDVTQDEELVDRSTQALPQAGAVNPQFQGPTSRSFLGTVDQKDMHGGEDD